MSIAVVSMARKVYVEKYNEPEKVYVLSIAGSEMDDNGVKEVVRALTARKDVKDVKVVYEFTGL